MNAPLTVLFLESSRNFGGQERRLLHEAALLADAGHRVVIACPADAALALRGRERFDIHPVPMRNSVHPPSVWALGRLIRRTGADLVYSHSGKDSWLGGIASFLAGVPLVRSRELLTPVRHRHAYTLFPKRVLACSAAVGRQLTEAGVPQALVSVQYPPVATRRFSAVNPQQREACRRELGLEGRYPVVATVARFMGEKRQVDVVRSMAAIRDVFPGALLLLVGSGPDEAMLRELARTQGVSDAVLMTGEREDVPAILACSDIFALPSSREPFGMAPVEAMAAGVPVVVANTGGLAEIVTDGVDGLHVPVASPADIARAVIRVCSDTDFRACLVAAGRRRSADFDEALAVERLVRHFHDVIDGPGG